MKKWIIGILIFLIVVVAGILVCYFYVDNFPLDMKLNGNKAVKINLNEEYNDEANDAIFIDPFFGTSISSFFTLGHSHCYLLR